MQRILKTYPFFLVLLPLFIVIHLEKEYHSLIHYRFVYREIIYLFLVPPIAFVISMLLMRSHRKAAILSGCFLILFYFTGELKEAIRFRWHDVFLQSYPFLFFAFATLLGIAAFILRRSKRQFERTYLFLNTLLLVFIVFDTGAITWSRVSGKQLAKYLPSGTAGSTDMQKPDIYYFIFDSYTSSCFLKEKFGFDNNEIDSTLRSKGFKIISRSKSNYNLTPFSVACTFNMDYFSDVDTRRQFFMRNYLPGVRKVYENPLVPALKQSGYEIYNHSIFDIREHPTTVPAFDLWDMHTIYRPYNLVKKVYHDIGYTFPKWAKFGRWDFYKYASDRDRHDSIALRHIMATIGRHSDKPRFVYGHLMLPHGPYTYDASGNKYRPNRHLTPEQKMPAYVQQIGYVNRIMTNLADSILTKARRPTVIIIQGDHGFRHPDPDKREWHFPNFNAIYFSNRRYESLHDSLTNVNTFRVVSNVFFHQNLPLLEGRTLFLRHF